MYVCLCKALTEAEVVRKARGCITDGVRRPCELIRALDLRSEDACGFCADHPEHIVAIFEDELEMYLGYTMPNEEPVSGS